MTPEQAQGISDERLGELWRMPDHYMRPISFARAVLALQKRADVVPLSEEALSIIAACRDAFPIPPPGSPIEELWGQAIGAPESVPDYLRAIAASQDSAKGGKPSDTMIDVAKRNLRAYLSKVSFASNVDREAALNCVEVLAQAAGRFKGN